MSRYRATTGELLEQIRQEAKTKDIYHMAFDGDNANTIAKKLKLDVATVKKVLGERFSMSDFKDNEKDNKHSENAFELAKQFGTGKEIHDMKAIIKFVNQRGYINKQMFDIGVRITKKYASKLEAYREVQEEILKEYNPNFGKDTSAGRTKETHADNKKTEGEDRVKSLENEIQRLKLELENEKNATVKPEPNPDTGEVPLTVGIAHKYIKDKAEKEKVKNEEVEIEESLFGAMYDKFVKAAQSMSKDKFVKTYTGKQVMPGQTKSMGKKDLEDIWVDFNEEVELTEYFATVHSDKKPIADFIKKYARTPSTQASIDYVDDDAGGNIEFEGKGAHDLADKVKAKFGVRVTKESFEPIENKSLDELTANDPMSKSYLYLTKPMTVQYTYGRNPISFMQTLLNTKAGKKLKQVFPRKMGSGEHTLKGTGQDHIDFLKVLNNKGIMPKNKIIGEELEEDTNKYITEKIKGLENKAKKTGMPYSILKKVYDRGMAAWKGGHRPGAGQQQWAFARVNSFVTKSSGTWGKADKDLAQKVRAAESVEQEGLINFDTRNPEYSAHTQDKGIISFIGQQVDFGPKRFIYVTSYNKNGKIVFGGKGGKKIADYIKSKGFKVTKESIEETRQLKDKEKEMLVSLDGKVIVIDKSDWDKYKAKGYIQAEDIENEACWDTHKQVGTKMKGGKRVPNCVPKNEELEEQVMNEFTGKFDKSQINKIRKAYAPLKGTKIAPGNLMKIFDKIDTNKNVLIQLFKADIPFVSQLAVARLISKHNMKGAEINKLREETEEIEESAASDQAKSMGLTYLKFGRYGKNGTVTHKSDGGALRKFDPKTGKLGDKEKPKFKKMSVADVNVDDIKGNELKIPNVANPSELVRGLKDKYGDKYKVTNGPTSVTITKNQDATSLSSKETEQEVKKLKDKIGLYKKDGSPSAGKLKGLIQYKIRSQSGAGDNLGFIEYEYKGSDTLEMDADEPDELVKVLKKNFGDYLDIKDDGMQIVTAKVKDFDSVKEDMQEADLTDKQVDMVKKVADKLPKNDFKKRYGKDADNVKFGTATNIVKKKLNIDGYDGARNLVDRLLKKEKGDE